MNRLDSSTSVRSDSCQDRKPAAVPVFLHQISLFSWSKRATFVAFIFACQYGPALTGRICIARFVAGVVLRSDELRQMRS